MSEVEPPAPNAAVRVKTIGKTVALLILLGGFLPFRPAGMTPEAWWLAMTTFVMAILWVTQAIPIAATSLLPLVAFPLFGIQPAADVSGSYINHHVFLYLGGFIIALGIERWGLHRRTALHVVRIMGTQPHRLVLGFMLATAFLSMWISNTASTLLMLPIGLAMLTSLRELGEGTEKEAAALGVSLMLGIAYSASLGGMTTLVGTPTNVSFVAIWEAEFRTPPAGDGAAAEDVELAPEISLATWMLGTVPVGALLLVLTWLVLTRGLARARGHVDRSFITQRLADLGPPTRGEWLMLFVFTITALLWMLRGPLGFPKAIHDSTIAVGMALLMFFVPVNRRPDGDADYLMDWETAERLPWNVLLLIGGGFAIANAFGVTGLSEWLGQRLAGGLGGWPPWAIVAAVCLLLTFLTEFTTNVATLNAVLPVVAAATVALEIDPRLVMIPATLCTSCAFMLPIATPPNAIVFASGSIPIASMVRYGIVFNLLSVAVMTAAAFFIFVPVFGITPDQLPVWAQALAR